MNGNGMAEEHTLLALPDEVVEVGIAIVKDFLNLFLCALRWSSALSDFQIT